MRGFVFVRYKFSLRVQRELELARVYKPEPTTNLLLKQSRLFENWSLFFS